MNATKYRIFLISDAALKSMIQGCAATSAIVDFIILRHSDFVANQDAEGWIVVKDRTTPKPSVAVNFVDVMTRIAAVADVDLAKPD